MNACILKIFSFPSRLYFRTFRSSSDLCFLTKIWRQFLTLSFNWSSNYNQSFPSFYLSNIYTHSHFSILMSHANLSWKRNDDQVNTSRIGERGLQTIVAHRNSSARVTRTVWIGNGFSFLALPPSSRETWTTFDPVLIISMPGHVTRVRPTRPHSDGRRTSKVRERLSLLFPGFWEKRSNLCRMQAEITEMLTLHVSLSFKCLRAFFSRKLEIPIWIRIGLRIKQ